MYVLVYFHKSSGSSISSRISSLFHAWQRLDIGPSGKLLLDHQTNNPFDIFNGRFTISCDYCFKHLTINLQECPTACVGRKKGGAVADWSVWK